jgi:phosphoribosylformimino-5-aminoimidazole carboxamide ribotide isomerase
MLVFPAIDLLDGKAVRLAQGRRETAQIYAHDPPAVARAFAAAGALRLHIVDLDAAFTGGARHNRAVIDAIVAGVGQVAAGNTAVELEVGGGIRTPADCERLFAQGVRHAVMGTAAIKSPATVAELCGRFPGRIVVAVDAREGRVAVEGWTEATGADAGDIGETVARAGAGAVLYTDIGRDGMRQGPNLEATLRLARRIAPCPVIASGGVARLEDLDDVSATGAFAVVVGKALYERAFTLEQALQRSAGL